MNRKGKILLSSLLVASSGYIGVLEARTFTIDGLGLSFNSRTFLPGFQEGTLCTTPFPINNTQLDVNRSLFVHDKETLQDSGVDFSLERTLTAMADSAGNGETASDIFTRLWDTQNSTVSGTADPTAAHCDDNGQKVNGFPLQQCPRIEGQEAFSPSNMQDYTPVAIVNRLDLTSTGWENCGEHRIVYGKENGGQNFVIFEAVLPNPRPGCQSACRDVVDFWSHLSTDPVASSRAQKLENFFYDGLVGTYNLMPVVHANHYSSSVNSAGYGGSESGQIRTNQFIQQPWLLKEFKTQNVCAGGNCSLNIVPISVKSNPYGELWENNGMTTPVNAASFNNIVKNQITPTRLGAPGLGFSYNVPDNYNAGESDAQNQFNSPPLGYIDNYNSSTIPHFNYMASAPAAIILTNTQVVNRAQALTCAGCHQPSSFGLSVPGSIAPTGSSNDAWPASLGFKHVNPHLTDNISGPGFDPAVFNGNTQGARISEALKDHFLPDRQNVLTGLYNADICNCDPTVIPVVRDVFVRSESQIAFKEKVDAGLVEFVDEDLVKTTSDFLKRIESTESRKNLEWEVDAKEIARLQDMKKLRLASHTQKTIRQDALWSTFRTVPKIANRVEQLKISDRIFEKFGEKGFGSYLARRARLLDAKRTQRLNVSGNFRVH